MIPVLPNSSEMANSLMELSHSVDLVVEFAKEAAIAQDVDAVMVKKRAIICDFILCFFLYNWWTPVFQ